MEDGPCCPADYARMFGRGGAARDASRYLRRGLSGSAATLATSIEQLGVSDATVLEVGGGVGGLHTRLLQHGASRAVTIDLSTEWEAAARDVLAELDLSDRVERRHGDFVTADHLAASEVVVLHRVVCCYPDWERMLERAADLSTRMVGFTFPRDRWPIRAAISVGNRILQVAGQGFRAFVHPADQMLALLQSRGFVVRADSADLVWRTVVMEQTAA